MRNFVAVTLLVTFLISAGLGLSTEIRRAQEAATFEITSDMDTFSWPRDIPVQDPLTTEAILIGAADDNDVNLVRRTVRQSSGDGIDVTYYVRLNHPTTIFDRIPLAEGRELTRAETQTHGAIVSTKAGETVGTPRNLAGSYDLTVRPLTDAFAALPVMGTYSVEADDRESFVGFLESLSQRVNDAMHESDPGAEPTAPDSFVDDDESVQLESFSSTPLIALSAFASLAVLGATAAALARDAATLGILRLHGHSLLRIWWTRLGRRGAICVGAGALLTALALLCVPNMDVATAARVLVVPIIVTGVLTAAASLLGVIVAGRVRISDLVKKRFA